MGKVLTSAIMFMRDNTSGVFVVSGNIHGATGEGLKYKMDNGTTYVLSKAEVERLQRYNYTPRYAKGKK